MYSSSSPHCCVRIVPISSLSKNELVTLTCANNCSCAEFEKLDESLGTWTLLSGSLRHKELLGNRESRTWNLAMSLNLLYTLPFSLQLPHLTSLHSLLTSLSVSIRPSSHWKHCYLFVCLCLSTFHTSLFPSFRLSTSLLKQRDFAGVSAGHLVSVLSGLLLKSAFLKRTLPFVPSTGDRLLVFIIPLSPHVHHHCLSPLPYVCFTFPASSLHQTHDCSLWVHVLHSIISWLFIASSLVVLSCSCHLWPRSPLTLLVHYYYS